MQLSEFTRSATLRWTLLVAGIFAAFVVVLLEFVYLKTKNDLTMRSDRLVASQIGVFADLSPERRLDAINEHLKQDPARVRLAGMFGSNGRRIAGNLERLPPDLKPDNTVQGAVVDRIDEIGREKQAVRLIARSLPNGDVMEALIHSLAGVGNNIAHDLRTPLARVRLTLERGRANARTLEQLQFAADKAIDGIDQSLSIITAILRLAEIENSQRLAGFGKVALADLVREVGDMYEPIAEDKGIDLLIHAPHELIAHGDRDLLIEAVANLVDNAVKFTPAGGRVEIGLFRGNGENIVRVKDTGPGISEHERDAVLRRFYRSDKIRHTSGLGLGLNLVTAIVKLHGFQFTIVPRSGCVVEIACPYEPTLT